MGRNYPKRKKPVFYSFRKRGFQSVILESAKQSQRNRGLRACCSHTKGGIWKHLLVFMKINARTNVIPSVQIFCRKKHLNEALMASNVCLYHGPDDVYRGQY